MTVDTVLVTVILVPFILAPFGSVGKLLLRVDNLRTVLFAKLLTELQSTCRTVFNALTAGNAVGLADMRSVSGSRKVRRVEKLRCSQRIAYFYITVADCKNFVLAVNVCDLMNKSVILGTLENFHSLIVSDVVTSSGFTAVVGHVAYTDAPALVVVRTALVELLSAVTAGADRCAEMTLVFFEPIGKMLDIRRGVLH